MRIIYFISTYLIFSLPPIFFRLQSENTHSHPFGFMESTSRSSYPNSVMSLITLRNCLTVVSCQLTRLRLLPTAQTMKAGGAGGQKVTDVSAAQSANA